MLSTFKLYRDKRLRLLVLLPLYSGFEQAFLAGDYTRVRPWGRGTPTPCRRHAHLCLSPK